MQEESNEYPLVSVVIPVYNGEKYISQTIDSVLRQDYPHFEIIVVNDGSSDSTPAILEKYLQKEKNIIVIHQKNSGVSVARNKGFEVCNGKFISFLDGDDTWLPENLSKKIARLSEEDHPDAVSSWCEIINEEGTPTGEVKKSSGKILLEDVLMWKGNYITIPSGILFRKSSFLKAGGFSPDLSNNADQELVMRFLHSGFSFLSLDEITWQYRKHAVNMSSNIPLMERDTLLCYQKAKEKNYFSSPGFRRKCFASMYLVLAGSWWKDGINKRKGLKYIVKALFSHPLFTLKKLTSKL